MLWPALRALYHGPLSDDRLRALTDEFALDPTPRTEGPGAAGSVAHRTFTEGTARLTLDLARVGDFAWVLTLFHDGERPGTDVVEAHRSRFRAALDRAGLTLVQIDPPATADEVLTAAPETGPDSALGAHWPWPHDGLDRVWPRLGVRADAPRAVKEVRLREVMRTPAWPTAPEALRQEAEAFLSGV
ncbi:MULTISPECIES: hypothetical protein [unclassified Streptomyces]|uniref:hypothetical protein n=1 Tax=unclassified Streptomyces TaxID=2593676 RepID=UPI0007F35A01|nr:MULTISPECIES: hypothetical protein [unclassified Streptomyces]MCM1971602.1 hypothetical protein [Streptomyces sp. G1]SBT90134.1 hypothetical protein GA0115233_101586 [Streptomyces sp. DI166]